MEYETLRISIGPVAELTLTRPQIDRRCLRELEDAVAALREAPAARVLLLTSAGADFCEGWSDDARSELLQRAVDRQQDPFGPLAELPLPVVAALRGAVVSAGLELALACDIRIAASDCRFAMPETAAGLLPLAGGSQRLPRVAGRGVALAMLLAGLELDAAAALRAGLVSKVVAPSDLSPASARLAATIAGRGPVAVRFAKEAVRNGLDLSLDQALRLETDLNVILQTTADREEGVRAFLEKRPARFEGR